MTRISHPNVSATFAKQLLQRRRPHTLFSTKNERRRGEKTQNRFVRVCIEFTGFTLSGPVTNDECNIPSNKIFIRIRLPLYANVVARPRHYSRARCSLLSGLCGYSFTMRSALFSRSFLNSCVYLCTWINSSWFHAWYLMHEKSKLKDEKHGAKRKKNAKCLKDFVCGSRLRG